MSREPEATPRDRADAPLCVLCRTPFTRRSVVESVKWEGGYAHGACAGTPEGQDPTFVLEPEPEPENAPGRLVAAIYLLMRDHVPSGRIAKVVHELNEAEADGNAVFTFSAPELEALARRYAEELIR